MSDYSEAEILAIESAFPGSHVYLCHFHREKAGNDGSKTVNMDLPRIKVKVYLISFVLVQMFHEGKQQDHYYQQALANLKASNVWKENTNVQEWLSSTWLSIPQV